MQAPEPCPKISFISFSGGEGTGKFLRKPVLVHLMRVDEEGVYRSFRRVPPGPSRTVNGMTKPLGNRWDKSAGGDSG
jgi:hypothetical protein